MATTTTTTTSIDNNSSSRMAALFPTTPATLSRAGGAFPSLLTPQDHIAARAAELGVSIPPAPWEGVIMEVPPVQSSSSSSISRAGGGAVGCDGLLSAAAGLGLYPATRINSSDHVVVSRWPAQQQRQQQNTTPLSTSHSFSPERRGRSFEDYSFTTTHPHPPTLRDSAAVSTQDPSSLGYHNRPPVASDGSTMTPYMATIPAGWEEGHPHTTDDNKGSSLIMPPRCYAVSSSSYQNVHYAHGEHKQ
jgi:hypothetical protein